MQPIVPSSTTDTSVPDIAETRRRLLEKLLRGDIQTQSVSRLDISPRPPDEVQHLSFAQERLWFLDQLTPESAVFNVPLAVRLTGPIDAKRLEQSVNEIVRRHASLRTTISTVDGRPVPLTASELGISLGLVDLTQASVDERESLANSKLNEAAYQPFSLADGPLIRASLLKLSETDHFFLVVMHHIVSDGWSLVIFFRELSAIYQALAQGKPSSLPEIPVQYSDYSAWQRDWLQGDVLAGQLSYWKTQLSGPLPVLDLPADRPRPPVQTHPGARVLLSLSEQLTRDLTELSRREGATLFMTLLAAFNVLLHRYTKQSDIIVGSPIANRPQAETENLIGFFLNNLAVRTDLSGQPTFRELLARVRQTALDAFANQDVPFETLIKELRPERDLSRTSIFQVYFNLFSFSDLIDLPDGEAISFVDAWLQSDENLSKFDLTLYAGAGDHEIKLALVYNTDLFNRERMAEMLAQLEHLLSQIVAQPGERISDYSLVTPTAQRILPNPAQPFPARESKAIQTHFSEQARHRPDQLAVIDPNESLSYGELETRSNQLANYLGSTGVSKGDIVAIYGHRSASLVCAVLGILKAGGAFMILDPAYPAPRLVELLKIAKPRALLQIEAAGPLPEKVADLVGGPDCPHLVLSARANDLLAGFWTENPNVETGPDDLAYLAFTSGSTGLPKGVLGRHGPLTLFASWAGETFGVNQDDRFCMLSGLAHDPLHRDMFTPLQLGGTVCIPDPADLENPTRLTEWFREQSVTIANLTPAMSQLLCESDTDTQIESLRYAFLVGDVLTRRDVLRLEKLAPAVQCVNLYGSTETQRAVSHFVVPRHTQVAEKEVMPLGKGIRDVQLLVLDSLGRLCGISEPGEVYFRSPHLARGYLGDESLTSERFLINPFTNTSGDRLYRTGDLGRYLPDGNVEHLGRADRQIKVRGFRIEPAEIEAALCTHHDVREAAVVAFRNTTGENYLAAYVVPVEPAVADTTLLRQHLSENLPAYSVPTNFVLLEALPLTPNGKLDRRALPEPNQVLRSDSHAYTAPRTPIEEALASIWKEVLGIEKVGIDDNFFELGGHSMMAVRLFAVMEKKFRKRLPLATLFQAPTVAQLGAILTNGEGPSWSSLVSIQPLGSEAPFFCVHAVGGNVLEYYDLARHMSEAQPFYALQSVGLDGRRAPHTRIEEMAAHYVKEIRELQPSGPYRIGGRSLGGMIAFEMACQLRAQGETVALLALLDSYPVGYNKLAPGAGSLRNKSARAIKKIRKHLSNIHSLSLRKKSRYIAGKAWFAALKLKSKSWRTLYRAYQNLGQPLPRALRNVREYNFLAAHSYVPRPYDGRVTLFWASNDLRSTYDLVSGWRALAGGGLEVHEIPGNHLDIIKEPHVQELAKKLSACLERSGKSEPGAVATGSMR